MICARCRFDYRHAALMLPAHALCAMLVCAIVRAAIVIAIFHGGHAMIFDTRYYCLCFMLSLRRARCRCCHADIAIFTPLDGFD